jgi:hypothetical protein
MPEVDEVISSSLLDKQEKGYVSRYNKPAMTNCNHFAILTTL